MDNSRRLPPELVAHARSFAEGDRPPAEPRDAATVVLLRPGPAGVESYLLRRHLGMPFAGGMYAFPGGGVDARDKDTSTAWAGPDAAEWAARMQCPESLARALVCAAVRETFEESGVLLAGPSADTVVTDTTGEDWEADRAGLVGRELAFSEFLHRRGLVLRSDLLALWAHWITPEFEPRRYDTRFFVAVLPAGQRTRDVSGEADRVAWMRPAAAVAGVDEESMRMLPPTYAAMRELSDLSEPADALARAAGRAVTTICPRVVFDAAGGYLAVD
ncbi:MAG TPA: NUDIX hydrolase [Nocardioidaceae bacterium]|nr:NUDIX hydrolase [Nocardioidaceae bacterium]